MLLPYLVLFPLLARRVARFRACTSLASALFLVTRLQSCAISGVLIKGKFHMCDVNVSVCVCVCVCERLFCFSSSFFGTQRSTQEESKAAFLTMTPEIHDVEKKIDRAFGLHARRWVCCVPARVDGFLTDKPKTSAKKKATPNNTHRHRHRHTHTHTHTLSLSLSLSLSPFGSVCCG